MSGYILIVDDDLDLAESLADVLDCAGYRTSITRNGSEALTWLQKEESLPDAIMLDLTMPVMDGWQFRREQRLIPSLDEIPVIVISADGSVRAKAASLAVSGYVEKPFKVDTLLDEVKRVLKRAR